MGDECGVVKIIKFMQVINTCAILQIYVLYLFTYSLFSTGVLARLFSYLFCESRML